MKVSYVGAAIIGVALLSCATPTENELPSVEFWTDRTAYVMGDSGVLTLTNGGDHSIVGDLRCGLVIQQMVGGSWESQLDPTIGSVACMLPLQELLAPGETLKLGFQVVVPAFASVGEYRFQLSAWDTGSRQTLVAPSSPFTVEN